jgi:hypothetical protein
MQICGQLKSGQLVKMTVEYHCKNCNISVAVPFWGTMTDEQLAYAKGISELLVCKTCYDKIEKEKPERIECLIN